MTCVGDRALQLLKALAGIPDFFLTNLLSNNGRGVGHQIRSVDLLHDLPQRTLPVH